MTLLASGCSYHWVTADGQLGEPLSGGYVLAVPPVINDTAEPLLSERLTVTLRQRLLVSGFRIDGSTQDEGMRLDTRVTSFSDQVLAFDGGGVASHRRVVLVLHITLRDGDETIWDSPLTIGSASYAVGSDATRNRDNKDRAVAEAAVDLSEQLLLTLISLEPR